jgi:hypothetical protein
MVTARSGTVTAGIQPNRPSWDDMYKFYPSEAIPSATFYGMVGKSFVNANAANPDSYSNTCAARMSYALNRSGMPLGVAPNGGNLKGDDGKNYWIRVVQLRDHLKKQFKGGDEVCEVTSISTKTPSSKELDERVKYVKENFLNKIKGKHGIVVFEVSGWSDASGHFTLWDGANLVYVGPGEHNNPATWEYYFWLLRVSGGKIIQTKKIIFWELK